jgi:hypothetical protein
MTEKLTCLPRSRQQLGITPLLVTITSVLVACVVQALGGTIDSNPCHMCSMPGMTCTTDPACIT